MKALEAGVDPTVLVDAINTAHAERVAAEEELANLPASTGSTGSGHGVGVGGTSCTTSG